MQTFPNFTYEIPLWRKGHTVIGIDEVGRGCLAGPVYVAACCLKREVDMSRDTSLLKKMQKWGIQDSKKISSKKRKALEDIMRAGGVHSTFAASSVDDINTQGIVKATQNAAKKAMNNLLKQIYPHRPYLLSDAFRINHVSKMGPTPETAITRGDQQSITIAAASIFAKLARDEYMTKLSLNFPEYMWQNNKGYGTKTHRNAILNSGPCIHHRQLFIKKLVKSAKTS